MVPISLFMVPISLFSVYFSTVQYNSACQEMVLDFVFAGGPPHWICTLSVDIAVAAVESR